MPEARPEARSGTGRPPGFRPGHLRRAPGGLSVRPSGRKERRDIDEERLMMISETLNAAINRQIGNEFGASLQYVAIAAHFANDGLMQLAARFQQQAEEERDHAMRFVRYLIDTGGRVEIPAIPAPKSTFESAADAVAHSLEQEKVVTRQINDLMALAVEQKDFAAQNFLNWFVSEQLEEVANMDNLLKVMKRAGEANLVYVEAYVANQASRVAAGPSEKLAEG